MVELLTLSRAARLVGIARGTLQQQIRTGELTTFEGKIAMTDLLRLYPSTTIEDTTMLERVARIKAEAKPDRRRDHEIATSLPSPEVLAARLTTLSQELVAFKAELNRYIKLVETVSQQLTEAGQCHDSTLRSSLRTILEWLRTELQNHRQLEEAEAKLLTKATLLRIIAAHVKLHPSGHEFWIEGNHSILEAALRAGTALNYGCSSGNCGLCKARVIAGEVRQIRHHDYVLSETEQRLGYQLMCSYTAVTDLTIEAAEAHRVEDLPLQKIEAKVKKLEYLNDNLLILHLQTPRTQTLRFFSGQTATLTTNSVAADYSIASCPCDGHNLQFHVCRRAEDAFAETVFNTLQPEQVITLEGPKGQFILQTDSTRPSLFLAYGHGFAPIRSLIEHAIALDTAESLHLYWLTSPEEGHYLDNLCRSWADALENFQYTPMTVEQGSNMQLEQALARIMEEYVLTLNEFEMYVAGPESFVMLAKTALQQQHLPETQLHLGYIR
jgi:CDP-4-dehydro-6-deoxyglucose reductase